MCRGPSTADPRARVLPTEKRAAPEPPAELAFLGWLKNQIRAQKNAGIKNRITFLYLYAEA